jgi:hypothetical protein
MVALFIMKMRTRFALNANLLLLIGIFLALASSCSPTAPATPFIPPTGESPLIEPALIINPTPQTVQIQSSPLPTIEIPTVDQTDCFNNLAFIEDITIPDNSYVTYGSTIDKQWRVENSGTCNWNSDYRLMHIGGAALGASEEVALYPARSNTQATLQIVFTAPFTDGVYESAWQAFGPDGLPFGDPIYIRILVAAP